MIYDSFATWSSVYTGYTYVLRQTQQPQSMEKYSNRWCPVFFSGTFEVMYVL